MLSLDNLMMETSRICPIRCGDCDANSDQDAMVSPSFVQAFIEGVELTEVGNLYFCGGDCLGNPDWVLYVLETLLNSDIKIGKVFIYTSGCAVNNTSTSMVTSVIAEGCNNGFDVTLLIPDSGYVGRRAEQAGVNSYRDKGIALLKRIYNPDRLLFSSDCQLPGKDIRGVYSREANGLYVLMYSGVLLSADNTVEWGHTRKLDRRVEVDINGVYNSRSFINKLKKELLIQWDE